MRSWFEKLRFLWEEEPAPPPRGTPRLGRDEAAGVPRPLRRATRFALIGFVSTSLMSQVIGIRLVAPVDAAPSYVARCIQERCKGLTGQARAECNHRCREAAEAKP